MDWASLVAQLVKNNGLSDSNIFLAREWSFSLGSIFFLVLVYQAKRRVLKPKRCLCTKFMLRNRWNFSAKTRETKQEQRPRTDSWAWGSERKVQTCLLSICNYLTSAFTEKQKVAPLLKEDVIHCKFKTIPRRNSCVHMLLKNYFPSSDTEIKLHVRKKSTEEWAAGVYSRQSSLWFSRAASWRGGWCGLDAGGSSKTGDHGGQRRAGGRVLPLTVVLVWQQGERRCISEN